MNCKNPLLMGKDGKISNSPLGGAFFVPCGKCLYCRIRRRKEWCVRLTAEMENNEKNQFITLTYNDENIKKNYSLSKRDLQLYFKRLRKILKNEKIKYYACGEYGDEKFRPHYHSIIFGSSCICNKRYCECHFQMAWKMGNVYIGSVTGDSIRYVAGYIDKKLYGEEAEIEYKGKGREPEFQLQSKGLGLKFFEKNVDRIIEDNYIKFNDVKAGIPRYFQRKIIEKYPDWKDKRSQEAKVYQVNAMRELLGEHIQSEFEDLEIKDQLDYIHGIREKGELMYRHMTSHIKVKEGKKRKIL